MGTTSYEIASRRAGELIAARLRGCHARIYEAGGGSLSLLPPSLLAASTISVVDIDEVQLNNNKYADIKIQGDIQTHSFPPDSFDLVVCNQVIEHLDHPDWAIRLFVEMLAPGGILFIGAPHPASFSGFVTKYSPHWFHVWFYRHVMGSPTAGQPGHAPFRTVYHRLVHPKELIAFCDRLGLSTIYFHEFPHWVYASLEERKPLMGRLLSGTVAAMNALTLGRHDLRNGDYQIVFEKRAGKRGERTTRLFGEVFAQRRAVIGTAAFGTVLGLAAQAVHAQTGGKPAGEPRPAAPLPLGPLFNPLDYGAVADGTTDNTATFATMMSAVYAAKGARSGCRRPAGRGSDAAPARSTSPAVRVARAHLLRRQRLAIYGAEPAEPHQLGDAARVLAIRLHRHCLERVPDMPGFEQLDRQARIPHAGVESLRQRPGLKFDPHHREPQAAEPADQRLRLARHLGLADDPPCCIHNAYARAFQ